MMKTNLPCESRALSRRNFLLGSAAGLGWLAAGAPAYGAEELSQATIIVGSPPGGSIDKLARLFADKLSGHYARRVIVENKPGAGGAIAYGHVKKSGITDGTLMFLSPAYPLVISPHVVNLPYDPLNDFLPVGIAGRSMMTISVGPSTPESVKTLADFIQWCRDNPSKSLYAGGQTGSSQHLVGVSLAQAANFKFDNVSYKGDAPAMQDLIGGHIPSIVLPIASAIPLLKDGRIRVLAVTGKKRSRFLPEIPTMIEQGYPDIIFQDWIGMFMRAGTPLPVLKRMNEAMNSVIGSEDGKQMLAQNGFEAEMVTAEEFAPMVKADYERYRGVIERTRFREIIEKANGR